MTYVLWSGFLYETAGVVCQLGEGRPPLRPLLCVGSQGLVIFLAANLMTGGVRLGLAPESAPSLTAILILTVYLAGLLALALFLGSRPRKWW